MAQNKDVMSLFKSHWQRDNSGVTDIYNAQNLLFSQLVQRLVSSVFGQSRQEGNYSGFAQLLYVSQKIKAKMS